MDDVKKIIDDLEKGKCNREQINKAIAIIELLDIRVNQLEVDLEEANSKIGWLNSSINRRV